MGNSFASRVAGSLLNAIGLSELITTNQIEFEDKAVNLALNPNQLKLIRNKLEDNRLTTPLFDSTLLTQYIENAYEQAIQRYYKNLLPDTIIVNPEPNNSLHNTINELFNKAVTLHQNAQLLDAYNLYQKIIQLDPLYADAYTNMGAILNRCKNNEAAIACYDKAITLNPHDSDPYSNRGIALYEMGRLEEALASYNDAITLNPQHANAYTNRGTVLIDFNAVEQALEDYNRAIAINPRHTDAYCSRGTALRMLNRLDDALSSYDFVINIKPNHAEALLGKSLILLLKGNLHHGFELYESRWQTKQLINLQRNFRQPLWLGQESLVEKTLLLHSEQGLGDTLQLCRYLALVADLGAQVIFEVEASLFPLLKSLPSIHKVIEKGQQLPDFDYHCPLMSLPLAFKTDLNSIPSSSAYIVANFAKVQYWKNKLGKKNKPRIGIVWSSVSGFIHNRTRSMDLDTFLQGLPYGVFDYICLQKEIIPHDFITLKNRNDIRFFGDELHDFSDTAALIDNMDLIISTCTSVPHLSAAMGKPTWICLQYAPDWRWLLDREDSPWYPSVRLFRQGEDRKWDSVLNQIRNNLENLLENL